MKEYMYCLDEYNIDFRHKLIILTSRIHIFYSKSYIFLYISKTI